MGVGERERELSWVKKRKKKKKARSLIEREEKGLGLR